MNSLFALLHLSLLDSIVHAGQATQQTSKFDPRQGLDTRSVVFIGAKG